MKYATVCNITIRSAVEKNTYTLNSNMHGILGIMMVTYLARL